MSQHLHEGVSGNFNDVFEGRRTFVGAGLAIDPKGTRIAEDYIHFDEDGRVSAVSIVDLAYNYHDNVSWVRNMKSHCELSKGRHRTQKERILNGIPISSSLYNEMYSVFNGQHYGGLVPVQTLVLPRDGGTVYIKPGLVEPYWSTSVENIQDFFGYSEGVDTEPELVLCASRHPVVGEDFRYDPRTKNGVLVSMANIAVNNVYRDILQRENIPHLARGKQEKSRNNKRGARKKSRLVFQRPSKAPSKLKDGEPMVVGASRCLRDITGAVGVLNIAAEILRTANLTKNHAFMPKHLLPFERVVLLDNTFKIHASHEKSYE